MKLERLFMRTKLLVTSMLLCFTQAYSSQSTSCLDLDARNLHEMHGGLDAQFAHTLTKSASAPEVMDCLKLVESCSYVDFSQIHPDFKLKKLHEALQGLAELIKKCPSGDSASPYTTYFHAKCTLGLSKLLFDMLFELMQPLEQAILFWHRESADQEKHPVQYAVNRGPAHWFSSNSVAQKIEEIKNIRSRNVSFLATMNKAITSISNPQLSQSKLSESLHEYLDTMYLFLLPEGNCLQNLSIEQKLERNIAVLDTYTQSMTQQSKKLAMPGHIARHWMIYTTAAAVGITAVIFHNKIPHIKETFPVIGTVGSDTLQFLINFWNNHFSKPARTIYSTIRNGRRDQELLITEHEKGVFKTDFDTAWTKYCTKWEISPDITDPANPSFPQYSSEFNRQLEAARSGRVYGVLSGRTAEVAHLEFLFIKWLLAHSMFNIQENIGTHDIILGNFVPIAEGLAILSTPLILLGAYKFAQSLIASRTVKMETKYLTQTIVFSVLHQMLREVDRLVNLQCGNHKLDDESHGLLIYWLKKLKDLGGQLFGKEREWFVQDINELQSPALSWEQKRFTIQRMMNTYPFLSPHAKSYL